MTFFGIALYHGDIPDMDSHMTCSTDTDSRVTCSTNMAFYKLCAAARLPN